MTVDDPIDWTGAIVLPLREKYLQTGYKGKAVKRTKQSNSGGNRGRKGRARSRRPR